MVIVRSKTILPAVFYEVNVMQYESISSMTVVSGYKYPKLLKKHHSFYHALDTKIKMFIRLRPNWEVEAQIFCWADFHRPHDIHCSEWTRKFKANHFMIIELSNCPAVLASIALFQWDWNQNIFFFNHDSKGSVPFNSKTAHPLGIPGYLTGVSLRTMRKLTHKWGLPGWAFDFHVKMLVSITNKRIS